ncbi:MAG: protein kinase [Elusimicrobia bacterium]|nr:protein kinase [Elusimicrobiota bacterium]
MRVIEAGEVVGGCRILAKVGEGGMGAVYKAKDEHLDREVAVKFLLEGQLTDKGRQRFLREAGSIAKCDHPGIVRIHSYGEHEGRPYFIMEFVEGKALAHFLAMARTLHQAGSEAPDLERFGYLPQASPDEAKLPYFLRPVRRDPLQDPALVPNAVALVAEVADALFEAYSRGILHRDVKPSNILIATDGRAKLVDFGLSKRQQDADLTSSHQVLGTLRYCSPERFKGGREALTPLSDLFSLGVVFYELATLTHPFEASDTAVFVAKLSACEPEPASKLNPSIPAEVGRILMRCLRREPKERWQSAKELSGALAAAAASESTSGSVLWKGLRALFAAHEPRAGKGARGEGTRAPPVELRREFDAADLRKVKIETLGGKVTLRSTEGSKAQVEFVPDDCGACAPRMRISGATLDLSVESTGRKGLLTMSRMCRAGFKASVPARLEARITTGLGDISVAGMEAGLEATTGTGDVALDGVRGRLSLKTGTGDVDGAVYSEDAEFKSGTGDLSLSWTSAPGQGRVAIKTGSGDGHLEFPEGTRMRIRLKSGAGSLDSEFGSESGAGFSVEMTSGAGDLVIRKLLGLGPRGRKA